MSKIFASIVFAAAIYAGPVSANGGGGAEPMPMTNFTDSPDFRPKLAPCVRSRHACNHIRLRQGLYRSNCHFGVVSC